MVVRQNNSVCSKENIISGHTSFVEIGNGVIVGLT